MNNNNQCEVDYFFPGWFKYIFQFVIVDFLTSCLIYRILITFMSQYNTNKCIINILVENSKWIYKNWNNEINSVQALYIYVSYPLYPYTISYKDLKKVRKKALKWNILNSIFDLPASISFFLWTKKKEYRFFKRKVKFSFGLVCSSL